jgi:hypothetical protein
MTDQHPITPPPELVEQWMQDHSTKYDLARRAVQWGADQELEACCEWLSVPCPSCGRELRNARRPKPPSLKETLLARVARIPGEGADAAYLRHWVDNESQRLVDLLHEVFKSLPD